MGVISAYEQGQVELNYRRLKSKLSKFEQRFHGGFIYNLFDAVSGKK